MQREPSIVEISPRANVCLQRSSFWQDLAGFTRTVAETQHAYLGLFMSELHDARRTELVMHMFSIVQISIGAQSGALLRQILQRVFGGKCLQWGLCITSDGHDRPGGAVYQDIVANMTGCFLMGLLSTSNQLKLSTPASSSIVVLPHRHIFQPSPAVLLGMKTGFCGSLTTFSSWMLQVGRMLLGGLGNRGQWNPMQAVFCVVIGLQGILHSYQTGAFIARYYGTGCAANASPGFIRGAACEKCQHQCLPHPHFEHAVHHPHAAGQGPNHVSTADPKATIRLTAAPNTANGSGVGICTCNASGHEHSRSSASPRTDAVSSATGLGACAVLLALTSTLVGLAAKDYLAGYKEWPSVMIGGALAPVGALARWQLARINDIPQRRSWKRFDWLPLGTLTANMLACATGGVLYSVMHRYLQNSIWHSVSSAVIAGVLGSLSTASTWAVEIEQLGQRQDSLQALGYSAGSVILAQVFIVAGYGWATWIY
eukprot:jgi/Ulvmu1/8246/UM041_0057.1